MQKCKPFVILFTLSLMTGLMSSRGPVIVPAFGAMPETEYRSALQIAEQKISRKKALSAGTQGLTAGNTDGLTAAALTQKAWLKDLLGSPYKLGDQWDVAVWNINLATMRKTSNPTQLQPEIANFGIFHYEVVNIASGTVPTVTVKITQTDSPQAKPIDSRVNFLNLTMTDEFNQIEKTYFFKGQSHGIRVSPEGIRSGMTQLELLPLDIPEIFSAERHKISQLPKLPAKIQEFADQIQLRPDFSQSAWFEQDDFFGRPIQVLWQQGDPWPVYLKTSYGIALLIRNRGTR